MEKINKKNIKGIKEGEKMNIIEKIVMGISGYFKENYSDHIFRKTVSMLVVLCFVLNIANLPAYAGKKKSRYENKEQIEEVKKEGNSQSVSYAGDESSGSVSYMQSLSDNIEVKDGVIYKKGKNGKKEAIGTWDGTTARIMDGEGKFSENATYTQAINNKDKKSQTNEISNPIENKESNIQENVKETSLEENIDSDIEERKDVTVKVIGLPEENKEKTEIAKETSVIKEQNKTEITKAESEEKEVVKETEEKKDFRDSEEYKEVVEKLAEDTGLSKEEIEKQLAEVEEEKLEEAVGVLRDFYKNEEATIINCATEALSTVLDMTSKGVLALQALLVEIATGVFNRDSIKNIDGKTQLMTSMNAMNEVLEMYGVQAGGYSIGLETFIKGLSEGESGIVWVNGDHYITVTKGAKGYSINDGGNVSNYKDESSIISQMSKKYSIQEGQDIKVLTNGQNIAKENVGKEISKEEMKEIKGAKTVTKTVTRTITVEKTKEVTVTKTRTVTRTATATATATGTDSEGNSYTYTYTYTYTYEEEEEYEETEEVTYEEEEEITETITEEVPDDTDEDKWGEDAEKEWNKELDAITDKDGKIKEEDLNKTFEDREVEEKVISSNEKEKTEEGKTKCEQRLAKYEAMSDEEFTAAMESGNVNVVSSKVVKVNDVSVNGTQASEGFVKQLNKTLGEGIAIPKGSSATDVINVATQDTAINVLLNGTGNSQTQDFANKVVSNGPIEVNGVSVDRTQGTLNYKDEKGNAVSVKFSDMTDKEYAQMLNVTKQYGGEAGTNVAKAKGTFESLTGTDAEGKKYTETPINDSQKGKTQITVRTYEDNSQKVVIQAHNNNYQTTTQQLYNLNNDGSGDTRTYTLANGTKFDVEGSISLSQASNTTYNKDGSKTTDVAQFGNDGNPISVQTKNYNDKGELTSIQGTDISADALLSEKQAKEKQNQTKATGTGSSSNPYEKYLNITSKLGDQKVTGITVKDKDGNRKESENPSKTLYSGFEYFKQGRIDNSKVISYNKDFTNKANNYATATLSNGATISVSTFTVNAQGKVSVAKGLSASISQTINGVTYTATAKTTGNNLINNYEINKDSIGGYKVYDGVAVYTNKGATFDKNKGFSGIDFSDSKSNIAILENNTYITGIDVSSGKAKYEAGSKIEQGQYSALMVQEWELSNWKNDVDEASMSVYKQCSYDGGKLTVYTTEGISFDKEKGTFSGGDFSNKDKNYVITASGYVSGIGVDKNNNAIVDESSLIQSQYNKEYVYNKLAEQTGLSREEIEKEFASYNIEENTFNQSMALLQNILENGGQAVNCAVSAMGDLLDNSVNLGTIAIQSLAIDMASGAFLANNKIGSDQINTSMAAMNQVLSANGKEGYAGYTITSVEDLKKGLDGNDGVVLNLTIKDEDGNDIGHYISLNKNEEGNVVIKDVNEKDVTIKEEELDKYLTEKYGWTSGTLLTKADIGLTALTQEQLQTVSGAGWLKNAWNSVKTTVSKAVSKVSATVSKVASKVSTKAATVAKTTSNKTVAKVASKVSTATNKVSVGASSVSQVAKGVSNGTVSVKNAVKSVSEGVKVLSASQGISGSKAQLTNGSWSLTTNIRTYSSQEIKNVSDFVTTHNATTGISGASHVYNETSQKWTVQMPTIAGGQSYTAAQIGNATSFVDGYKKAQIITDNKAGINGSTFNYNTQNKSWEVAVGVHTISTNDIDDATSFVDGYKKAQAITNSETGIAGSIANYNTQNKSWEVSFGGVSPDFVGPLLPSQKAYTISTNDIGDVNSFISGYNQCNLNANLANRKYSTNLYCKYNTETKEWNLATTIDIGNNETMEIVKYNNSGSISEFVDLVENIDATTKAYLQDNSSTNKENASQAYYDLAKYFKDNGKTELYEQCVDKALEYEGITVEGSILNNNYEDSNDGIVYDKKTETDSEITLEDKETILNYGIEAWYDSIKGEGRFKSETLRNGDVTIYTATKVDYNADSRSIALQYDFGQSYNDQIYFTNIQSGQSKVLVESYKNDENGLLTKDNAMVYDIVPPQDVTVSGTDEQIGTLTTSVTGGYDLENGIHLNVAINGLDKVVEWSVDSNNAENKVAKVVDFVNGNGKASGFEEITIDKNGKKDFTRYELNGAYRTPEEKEKYDNQKQTTEQTIGQKEATIVDEYKQILDNAASMQITETSMKNAGCENLYECCSYVDNSWIKLEEIKMFSYSDQTLATSIDINNISVNVSIDNVGSDWRNHLNDSYKDKVVTYDYEILDENGNGTGVHYNGTTKLTEDTGVWYDNLKNGKCEFEKDENGNQAVQAYTYIGENIVYQNSTEDNKLAFDFTNLGSGADFNESAMNDNSFSYYTYDLNTQTAICGLTREGDTLKTVDGTQGIQGDYIFTIAAGNVNDWKTNVVEDSWNLKKQTTNGVQVFTSNGVAFNRETGLCSGGSFEDSSKNFVQNSNGTITSGIEVKEEMDDNNQGIVVAVYAYFKDSTLQGFDEGGNRYNTTLMENIDGKLVTNDFKYEPYIEKVQKQQTFYEIDHGVAPTYYQNISASEDGTYWRVTGTYTDADGFGNANLGYYSDYFAQSLNGKVTVANITKTADGYITNSSSVMYTKEYNTKTQQYQNIEVSIGEGVKVDNDFLDNGYTDYIKTTDIKWLPTQEQAQEIANSHKVDTDYDDGFVTDTSTRTETWKEWDYETGTIVEYESVTTASEDTWLFFTCNNSYQTTVKRNGEIVSDTGKVDTTWNMGWYGNANALKALDNNTFHIKGDDEYEKYLNAMGFSLSKTYKDVDNGITENSIVVSRSFKFNDGTVHQVQETYKYNGSDKDFDSKNDYSKEDLIRTSIKTSAYTHIDTEIENDDIDGSNFFIYNTTGSSTEVKVDNKGNATDVAYYQEHAFVNTDNNIVVGTYVMDGQCKNFETGLEYDVMNQIVTTDSYEQVVGSYIDTLTNEKGKDYIFDLVGITLKTTDSEDVKIIPYYRDTDDDGNKELIYEDINSEQKSIVYTYEMLEDGYDNETGQIKYSYQITGKYEKVYDPNMEKSDEDNYTGNDGKYSYFYIECTSEEINSAKNTPTRDENGDYNLDINNLQDSLQGFVVKDDLNSNLNYRKTGSVDIYGSGSSSSYIEFTATDNSIATRKFKSDFSGNETTEYSIESIRWNDSQGFVVTAKLNLKDKTINTPFIVKGSIETPKSNNNLNTGNSSKDEEKDIKYEVSCKIDGDTLYLADDGSGKESSVAVTFGLSEMSSGKPIQNYTFDHFYAGTNLTFYEQSNLKSINNNVKDISNSSVDVGEIVGQELNVVVSAGSQTVLKTDTSLSELAGAVVTNGVTDGTLNVTNIFTINNGTTVDYLKVTSNMQSDQTWKDATKQLYFGSDLTNLNIVKDGAQILGGTYNESKCKIEMGGLFNWNGTININSDINTLSLEKGWAARTVECAWGTLVSIGGAITAIVGYGWAWGGDNAVLKYSASLFGNKQYNDVTSSEIVRAGIGGAVAVAAIAVTILTGGMGAAAFIPALGGTTAGVGAVVTAGVATFTSSFAAAASLTASALVTAYFASQAAMNAYDAIQNGDGLSAFLNIAACMMSIAFPVRIGNASKTMSFALQSGSTNLASAKAAIKAFNAGQDLLKEAKATGKAIEELGELYTEYTSALDAAKGLGLTNIETAMSSFGLSKDAINAIVQEGLKNGANSATNQGVKLALTDRIKNFGKGILGNSGTVQNGVLTGQTGILGSLQNARSLILGGGLGGSFSSSLTVWAGTMQSLTTHMYSMFGLNVAMNAFGGIAGDSLVEWSSGWNLESGLFGGAIKSFFADTFKDIQATGNQSALAVNPGQSLQFALIMYVGMPTAKGIVGGVKDLFNFGLKGSVASKIGLDKIVNKVQSITDNKLFGSVSSIANGAYEEWFSEGFKKKFILQGMFGVSDEMSEVLVEFMDPDSAGIQYTNETYAQQVSQATCDNVTQNNAKQYSKNINNVLAANNISGVDISVSVAEGNNGYIFSIGSQKFNVTSTKQLQSLMLSIGSVASTSGAQKFEESVTTINNYLAENTYSYSSTQDVQNLMLSYAVATSNLGLEANNTNLEGTAKQDFVIENIAKAMETARKSVNAYNGLQQSSAKNMWRQFVTGNDLSITTQQKVGALSIVSKYINETTGEFDVNKLITAINSQDSNTSQQAYDDLCSIVLINNMGILNANTFTQQVPSLNNETIIKAVNGMQITSNSTKATTDNMLKLAQLANSGLITDASVNSAIVNKINSAIDFSAEQIIKDTNYSYSDIVNLFASLDMLGSAIENNNANNSDNKVQEFNDNVMVLHDQLGDLIKENSKKIKDIKSMLDSKDSISEKIVYLDEQIVTYQNDRFMSELLAKESSKINLDEIFNIEDSSIKAKSINEIISNLHSNDLKVYFASKIYGDVRDSVQNSHGNDGLQTISQTILNNGKNSTIGSVFENLGYDLSDEKYGYLQDINITQEMIDIFDAASYVDKAEQILKEKQIYMSKDGTEIYGFKEGQKQAILDAMTGNNIAMLAGVGFGKTLIASGVALARALRGETNMDLIVANSQEYQKYLTGTLNPGQSHEIGVSKFIQLANENGGNVTIYDMDRLAQNAQQGINVEEFEAAMNDKNGLRIWTGEQMGFLGTSAASQAAQGNSRLQNIISEFQEQTDRLTIADEVHKFMESQTSFILSNGSNNITEKWTKKQTDGLLIAYTKAAELIRNGEISVASDTGEGSISKELSNQLDVFAEQNGINRTWIDSSIKAILEKQNGKDTYALALQENGSYQVVPVANGNKENGRVFQDAAYAYAASRMANEVKGEFDQKYISEENANNSKYHTEALKNVSVSKTDFGTSGSRLFFGNGQYIGMSGTLSHVQDMAASFGMTIAQYGDEKSFEIVTENAKGDQVLFVQTQNRQEIVDNIVNSIINNLEDTENARNQVVVSVDVAVREQVRNALIEKGYGDRILNIETDTEKTDDIINREKDKGANAKIIIGNEKAGMGLDYTGNFDLLVDSSQMSASLLTQVYGRVTRHGGETATRTVFGNQAEVSAYMEKIEGNSVIISGIYEQLKASPSKEDQRLLEDLFNNDGTINETKLSQEIRDFQLSKLYMLYNQSSQSLVFGLTDTVKDRFLTAKLNELLVKAGYNTEEGKVVYNVLSEILNAEQGSTLSIEGENSEIVDGEQQLRNSLANLENTAKNAFKTISTTLGSDSEIGSMAQDLYEQWDGISQIQETSDGFITTAKDLNKAAEIMLGYGSKVMATYGSDTKFKGIPTTLEELSTTLSQKGISKENIANVTELLKTTDNLLLKDGKTLTNNAKQIVSNYIKLNDDDDLAKALMLLLMEALGLEFTSVSKDDNSNSTKDKEVSSKDKVELATWLMNNNVSIDNLIEFNTYCSAYNVDVKNIKQSQILEILTANYDENVIGNMKGRSLSAVAKKMADVVGADTMGLTEQYEMFNDLYSQTEKLVYNKPLSAKEQIYCEQEKFKQDHEILSNINEKISSFAKFGVGTISYMLFKAPFVSILSSLYGDSLLSQPLAVITTNVISDLGMTLLSNVANKVKSKNKKESDNIKLGVFGNARAKIVDLTRKASSIISNISLQSKSKKINKLLDSQLTDVSDLSNEEIKSKMSQAGIKVDEDTDTAIANMKAYISSLSESEAKAVKKALKLSDINRFENMPQLISDLESGKINSKGKSKAVTALEKSKFLPTKLMGKAIDGISTAIKERSLVSLTDKEKFVLNGLLSAENAGNSEYSEIFAKLGMTMPSQSKEITVGTIRSMMEQTRGEILDITLPTDEEILEITFKMLYPSKDTATLIERYNYVMDNVEFDVLDDMKLSVIADDNNFIYDKEGKLYSTDKGFEEKYEKLLRTTTYSQSQELVYKEERVIEELKEIKVRLDEKGETVGLSDKEIEKIIEIGLKKKYATDDRRNYYLHEYLVGDEEQNTGLGLSEETYEFIRDMLDLTRKGEKHLIELYAERGIDYKLVKANNDKIVEVLETKGIKNVQTIVGTLTLEDLNNSKLVEQLIKAIEKELISVKEESTRDSMIKDIKDLTPEQIIKTIGSNRTIGDFLFQYGMLLEMAGLDVEQLKENKSYENEWIFNSKVVREFSDKIDFYTPWTLEKLSSLTFKKDVLDKQTATEAIKKTYEDKTYEQLMAGTKEDKAFVNLSESDREEFFKLIGLDYGVLKSSVEALKKSVTQDQKGIAEELAKENEAISIKEFNTKVEETIPNDFIGKLTVKQLSNTEYVGAVKTLIDGGVITVADIVSGKTIDTIIKGKEIGTVRKALGKDYEKTMKTLGLSEVVEKVSKLEKRYTSDIEKVYISQLTVEAISGYKEESLKAKEYDKKGNETAESKKITEEFEAKVASFLKGMTFAKAQELGTREGVSADVIINSIPRTEEGVTSAIYAKNKAKVVSSETPEIKKAIDNMSIVEFIENSTIVEEIKGLQEIGKSDKEISEIITKAGESKKTIKEYISGLTYKEFEELTAGISKDNITKLYEYIGLDVKKINKNKKALSKLDVPEELIYETVTMKELSNKKLNTNAIVNRVNAKYYKGVTVDQYIEMSEEERAKYETTKETIDANIRELTSGEDSILKGYILSGMTLQQVMDKETAEKYIENQIKTNADKYYKKMTGEDFVEATIKTTESTKAKNEKATKEARKKILGEEGYSNFAKNYSNLSREARFGEGVKKVSVEVLSLSEQEAYNSIYAVAGEGLLEGTKAQEVKKIEKIAISEEVKVAETKQETVEKTEEKAVEEAVEEAVVGEVEEKVEIKTCAEVAIETLGEIVELTPLTYLAIKANPYAQDELLAAGVGETLDEVVESLGSIRQKTGFKYATVTTEKMSKVETPFVAYMQNKDSKVGHVVTVTECDESGVIYTSTDAKGNVVEEIKTMEEFEAEGFTGLILAKGSIEGISYIDEGTNSLVGELFKGKYSKAYESGKKMLEEIVNGVTEPNEMRKALEYVLEIWDKDMYKMMNYIGISDKETNKEEVIKASISKISEVIELGKKGELSEAEVKVEIELITAIRDLAITAIDQTENIGLAKEWIKNTDKEVINARLAVSKAVNQNVIVNVLADGIKAKVVNAEDKDFVIDVKKLQSAIVDRKFKFAKDAKIDDVMNILKDKKNNKFRTPMMSLRDIHAVAASA